MILYSKQLPHDKKNPDLSRRGLVNRWKGQGFTIDLCFEHDKLVYFWSWGCYLLYNAVITRKKKLQKLIFQWENLPPAILFILSAATAIITHAKSYELSTMLIHLSCLVFLFTNVTPYRNDVEHCILPKARCGLYLVSRHLNIIFMLPLYETVILFHYIINPNMSHLMTKPTKWQYAKLKLRSAWALAQSDQSLCCALNG